MKSLDWIGAKFTCFRCQGEFQLEESDRPHIRMLAPITPGVLRVQTPRCPTIHCNVTNVIDLPVRAARAVAEIGGA